jgi:hypothetical protein
MSRLLGRDYKDKDEAITYTHDCTPDLGGSTVSSVSWVTRPSGLTTDSTSSTTTSASIKLSGGTPGQLYTVELTATLADAQIIQASHEVQVLN